jgi:hypothetical protein
MAKKLTVAIQKKILVTTVTSLQRQQGGNIDPDNVVFKLEPLSENIL